MATTSIADKQYLQNCLQRMKELIENELHLEFNSKTQITPVKNGVNYLGWHFYLTDTGKIIRKVSRNTKRRYIRKLGRLERDYAGYQTDLEHARQVLTSYHAHLSHGNTYKLRKKS